jgi:hypothetical protein
MPRRSGSTRASPFPPPSGGPAAGAEHRGLGNDFRVLEPDRMPTARAGESRSETSSLPVAEPATGPSSSLAFMIANRVRQDCGNQPRRGQAGCGMFGSNGSRWAQPSLVPPALAERGGAPGVRVGRRNCPQPGGSVGPYDSGAGGLFRVPRARRLARMANAVVGWCGAACP